MSPAILEATLSSTVYLFLEVVVDLSHSSYWRAAFFFSAATCDLNEAWEALDLLLPKILNNFDLLYEYTLLCSGAAYYLVSSSTV